MSVEKTMHELKSNEYWSFDHNHNEIYRILRWEEEDKENIPIIMRVASFWTNENQWKLYQGNEERCNPYARVNVRKFTFEEVTEDVS